MISEFERASLEIAEKKKKEKKEEIPEFCFWDDEFEEKEKLLKAKGGANGS